MITSSNADFNQEGFASVIRDLERAYLLLAESGIQGGDSPTSTTLSFTTGESNPSNTNLTIQPWEMKNADTNPAFFIKPVGGTILYDNSGNKFSKGSTVPIKYGDTFSIESMNSISGNWLDSSGVNPTKGNGGNARGVYAIDWQIYRSANDQVVSGYFSIALGNTNKNASYKSSIVGFDNTVTGLSSLTTGNYPFLFGANIFGSKNVVNSTSVASGLNCTISGYNNNISTSGSTGIPSSIALFGNNNILSILSYGGNGSYFSFGDSNSLTTYGSTNVAYAYGSNNTIKDPAWCYGSSNYFDMGGNGLHLYGLGNSFLTSPTSGSVDQETKYLSNLMGNVGVMFGCGSYYGTILRSPGCAIVLNCYSMSSGAPSGNNIHNAISFRHATNTANPFGFVDGFSFSHNRISNAYASTAKPRIIYSNSGISIDSNSGAFDASDVSLQVLNTGNTGIDLISSSYPYFRINGTQLLTTQQAAIANVSYNDTWSVFGADIVNKINDLLAKLRTHGIIAT